MLTSKTDCQSERQTNRCFSRSSSRVACFFSNSLACLCSSSVKLSRSLVSMNSGFGRSLKDKNKAKWWQRSWINSVRFYFEKIVFCLDFQTAAHHCVKSSLSCVITLPKQAKVTATAMKRQVWNFRLDLIENTHLTVSKWHTVTFLTEYWLSSNLIHTKLSLLLHSSISPSSPIAASLEFHLNIFFFQVHSDHTASVS